eukprot:jgi/Mesvir1/2921/Mv13991-RA.1
MAVSSFIGSAMQNSLGSCSGSVFGSKLQIKSTTAQSSKATVTSMVRRWDKVKVNDNGKVERVKVHVKVGDSVQVISGKDKGKVTTVEKIDTSRGMVMLKDVNLKTNFVKGTSEEEQGSITVKPAPIHHSNVMLYSKEAGLASRVGHKVNAAGKKVRYLLKTGEELP